MKLVLLSASALPSNDEVLQNILQFQTVAAFNDHVKTVMLSADLIIVLDNILGSKEMHEYNKILLKETLSHSLLNCNKICFLIRKSHEEEQIEFFNNLQAILELNNMEVFVEVKPRITLESIEEAMDMAAPGLKQEVGYNLLIKKRRGEDLKQTTELEQFRTSSTHTLIVQLNTVNQNIDKARYPYQKNNRTIKPTVEPVEEVELEPLELLNINLNEDKGDVETTKIIAITGKTGVTTTALTLARSSCELGKTLFIDADYNSLGASYIIQERADVFSEDLIEQFMLEDIIANGDLSGFKAQTLSEKRLHVIRLSLPLINKLGLKEFECCLIQLLNLVKSNYSNIIIDMPHIILNRFSYLTKMADLLIEVVPPYKNKFVPSFKELASFECIRDFVDNDRLIVYRVGINEVNNLGAYSYKIVENYLKEFFSKEFPVTEIFTFHSYIRPDIFSQIYNLVFKTNSEVREEVRHANTTY